MIPGDPLADTAPSLKLAGIILDTMVSARTAVCVGMKRMVMMDRKAEMSLVAYHFWRS